MTIRYTVATLLYARLMCAKGSAFINVLTRKGYWGKDDGDQDILREASMHLYDDTALGLS